MADSSTLRSRRSRAHARGDCTWCRHGPRSPLVMLPAGDDTPVDPRAALERLASRLEGASIADPGNANVAKELRMTLAALTGEDPDAGFDFG